MRRAHPAILVATLAVLALSGCMPALQGPAPKARPVHIAYPMADHLADQLAMAERSPAVVATGLFDLNGRPPRTTPLARLVLEQVTGRLVHHGLPQCRQW